MALTRREIREIFEAVEKGGLDPSECELVNSRRATYIEHSSSGRYIGIAAPVGARDLYHVSTSGRYSIFVNAILRSGYPGFGVEWPGVIQQVERWASRLAGGDVWQELIANRKIQKVPHNNNDNEVFTASEREEVRKRLRQIPAQARERFNLSGEQESGIEQKLEELIDASERVGKKDWLVMVYGAAFGLIVSDEIPAHVVQGIVHMIIAGLGHAFGVGGPPSVIPPHA